MKPLLSLRDVSAGYEGREVLSGVSFDVYSGDFLGVTGPNGGGKTTLVRVIMGLLPYSGSITYDNSLIINGMRSIGYLPQQSVFDRSFPISVGDVVISGLQGEKKFTRRYTGEDFDEARKLLNLTGIADLERRPIGEISGGQMQRALLCRALISRPRLLILDEPTTYVDSRFENELYGLLRDLNDGLSIVMVSHNNTALSSVAKRVVRIDGRAEDIHRM
jgi:zinc transport system ATP-binding protein